LMHRRSYAEIKAHYSPMLPDNVAKLNDVNINNHRKHSDPRLLALRDIKNAGEPTTEGEILTVLFKEQYKEVVDKHTVLKESLRERIHNLMSATKLKVSKLKLLEELTRENPHETTQQMRIFEEQIIKLTVVIDDILSDIQATIIKDINSEKGVGDVNVYITQNITNLFQTQIKSFIDDVAEYLMVDIFGNDNKKAVEVIRAISRTMDKHITPAFAAVSRL